MNQYFVFNLKNKIKADLIKKEKEKKFLNAIPAELHVLI
jgi:hypothetical protein